MNLVRLLVYAYSKLVHVYGIRKKCVYGVTLTENRQGIYDWMAKTAL